MYSFWLLVREKKYAKRVPPICVYHKYSLEAKKCYRYDLGHLLAYNKKSSEPSIVFT